MEEPFCKTQSNPVVAPWSFLGDQFVDNLLWMKFLLKISQAILAYLKFLHLVHLAIGFHKVSSNRSSQIDWTEVVGIAFFFWTGAGFKILEALKTLRSSPPQNPHGRLIFFVFKYIYICGCIYQLPLPIHKMVFQIFYKMEVPDTGIWSCSHKKWCWVCINRSLSTKWSAPTAKKIHKIWFIGGPRPTILNGKCQRGLCSHIFTKVSHTFHQESFAFQLPIPHLVSSSHATIMVAERFTPSTQWTKTLELGSSKAAWQRGRISEILQTIQVSIEFTEIQLAQLVSSCLCKPWENSLSFLQNQ